MTAEHDCVRRINSLLADKNTVLAQVISFGPGRELIQLATEKADEKKRGKPALFFASYCPFCGVDLDPPQDESESTRASLPASDRSPE